MFNRVQNTTLLYLLHFIHVPTKVYLGPYQRSVMIFFAKKLMVKCLTVAKILYNRC